MTDPSAPAPKRNGNGGGTVLGGVVAIGRALVTELPPGFLMLVLLNMVFLGMVMWFLGKQMEHETRLLEARAQFADKLLTTCLSARQ